MGRHTLLRTLLAAAMAFGAVLTTVATPAMAETTVTATADIATFKRDFTRRIALEPSQPGEVRTEAWNALLSNRGDAAINDFLVKGGEWDKAKARAKQRIESNDWFVNYSFRNAITGSHVHHEADKAMRGTDNDKDLYVRVEYDKAVERDRIDNNKREERLARLAKEDRDYVTYLANNDPGLQVRAAAQRAIAGSDVEVGLFFKYYWAIGARLDDARFRTQATEQNQIFMRKVELLQQAALAAEAAERESSGELARKHRQDAINNWEAADEEAKKSRVDWLAEQGKADEQAAAWRRVADFARTAQSEQDWEEVLRRANEGNTSWADEAAEAVKWADSWKAISEDMRKRAEAAKERDTA